MTDTKARALLSEAKRRGRLGEAVAGYAKTFFPRQKAVWDSERKRIVLKMARRSGKTHLAPGVVLRAAERFPGAVIPVCERATVTAAAVTFWRGLMAVDEQYKLDVDFRHTAKEAILPNKSTIRIFGVDTLELADKLRGDPYPTAFIDEGGTYRSHILRYLIDDVLGPSLLDYDGQLYIAGTPGLVKKGTWYELCHNDEWEQHHWTLLDNTEFGKLPHQKSREWREQALADIILSNGWYSRAEAAGLTPMEIIQACQHPTFRREYMGEWVDGSNEQMYELGPRNIISRLPKDDPSRPWRYGLSIDIGYEDPCAFVVSATRKGDPYVYVVESYYEAHLIPSSIAAHIDRLRTRYGRFAFIVADVGGAGKMAAEEMKQKYGLPIEAAKKTGKRVFVEHVNGDLRTGRIQVVERMNTDLIEDLYRLPWNEDKTDAAEGLPDHLPDAFLYGVREWVNTRIGWGEGDKVVPVGSEEWLALQDAADEKLADDLAAADRKRSAYLAGEDPFEEEGDYGDY